MMNKGSLKRSRSEVIQGIEDVYNKWDLPSPYGEGLDRYLANYDNKCDYHGWLLGEGNDSCFIDIEKSKDIIKQDFIDYCYNVKHTPSLNPLVSLIASLIEVNNKGKVTINGGQRVIRWLNKMSLDKIPDEIKASFNRSYKNRLQERYNYINTINRSNEKVIKANPNIVVGVTWEGAYHEAMQKENTVYTRWGDNCRRVDTLILPMDYKSYCKQFGLKPVKSVKTCIKEMLDEIPKFIANLEKYNQATSFKILISAKPEDFVTASANTTGWRSCFAPDGEYHCSVNAFYPIRGMLIAKILNDRGEAIGRRWFYVNKDKHIVCSGLEYGSFDYILTRQVREAVQAKMEDTFSLSKEFKWYKTSYTSGDGFSAVYLDAGWTYTTHRKFEGGNPPCYDFLGNECTNGLDADNYDYGNGTWCEDDRASCYSCGDRISRDESHWVARLEEYVCECCTSDYNYDTWNEEYTSYDLVTLLSSSGRKYTMSEDYSSSQIYLEDLECYCTHNYTYYEHRDGLYYSYEEVEEEEEDEEDEEV